jgi:hypothetical protein
MAKSRRKGNSECVTRSGAALMDSYFLVFILSAIQSWPLASIVVMWMVIQFFKWMKSQP